MAHLKGNNIASVRERGGSAISGEDRHVGIHQAGCINAAAPLCTAFGGGSAQIYLSPAPAGPHISHAIKMQ